LLRQQRPPSARRRPLRRGADRVAIVDWDVHHGNGGQDICYDRGDIFNVSLHEAGLYPGTGEIDETGEGDGEMCNLNVPFPPGTNTVGYLAAFDEVILPLREYDPDLVLVSAGFDAHQHDPISRMRVSTEGYGLMTERLAALVEECDAGLGFVLEGGYSSTRWPTASRRSTRRSQATTRNRPMAT